MALFGKKKEAAPQRAPPTGTPTDLVIQMRQQGQTNNQIIDQLQRQGYSSAQIFDAMSQADIKGIVESGSQYQPQGSEMPMQEEMMPEAPMPPMPPQQQIPTAGPTPGMERQEIEEVAEGIIDEKWDELMKSVDKIIEWKEMTEKKLTKMEQEITDMKNNFDELHKGVLARIGEYDKGIKNVGTEIQAMEQVFKKLLPSFTEDVGELSRITKKLKQNKK